NRRPRTPSPITNGRLGSTPSRWAAKKWRGNFSGRRHRGRVRTTSTRSCSRDGSGEGVERRESGDWRAKREGALREMCDEGSRAAGSFEHPNAKRPSFNPATGSDLLCQDEAASDSRGVVSDPVEAAFGEIGSHFAEGVALALGDVH